MHLLPPSRTRVSRCLGRGLFFLLLGFCAPLWLISTTNENSQQRAYDVRLSCCCRPSHPLDRGILLSHMLYYRNRVYATSKPLSHGPPASMCAIISRARWSNFYSVFCGIRHSLQHRRVAFPAL
ncbi:hypothetical protein F4775DRAFT_124785 [Biscogniauxia sp. FL1348]|nr:hypothetical protein F4775DRAFT_124785 [Biscogniauxia sp. FL1348]